MIFLDNSATTKPESAVLSAFTEVNNTYWGNPSSSNGFGEQAEQLLTRARKQVADILGAESSEIIFTAGATESNNIAIKGIAMRYQNRGKHLIVSATEHPSVSVPMEQLQKVGFDVTILPVNQNGHISVTDVKNAMRDDTILVSIMHVNNETGAVQPIAEIGQIVRAYPKAFFHVDGVQGFGKVPLDIVDSSVDLYSLSAHKFNGIKGTGILYIKSGILIEPIIAGGSQERKLRSGTVNVAGAVTVAKAMRIATDKLAHQVHQLKGLQLRFYEEISRLPETIMNTPSIGCAPHIVNFSIPAVNTEVFMRMLEEKQIYLSTTSACSSKMKSVSKVVQAMGKSEAIAGSTVRVSLCYETTESELMVALETIKSSIVRLSEVGK